MNYTSRLFSTGAVRETPPKVMQAMLAAIGKESYHTVVEIGAGKGELTRALLKYPISFDQYHAFEINGEACQALQEKFPAVTVHQANAFLFAEQLPAKTKVSLFLSSIPLSFYSRAKVKELLSGAKERLDKHGKIIIIFTAPWLIPFLRRQLPGCKVSGFFTFPPYFVLSYQKK